MIEREFFKAYAGSGDASQSIPAAVEQAIPVLESAGDDLGVSRALRLRSEVELRGGHWGARAETLSRALEHARRAGAVRDEPILVALLAQALYYGPTPVEEAIARCEAFLAEVTGERSLEAALGSTLAGLRAMRGDFEEARRLWQEASAIYEELGLDFRRAARSPIPAAIEALAGDDEAAERELRWGYDTLEKMGEKAVRATIAAFLAEPIYRQGRLDEAERFSKISEDLAAGDDLVPQVVWRSVRARVLARRGELDQAETMGREALRLVADTDFPDVQAGTLLALAEVLDAAGKHEEAAPLAAEARALHERKGNIAAVQQSELWSARPTRAGGTDEI